MLLFPFFRKRFQAESGSIVPLLAVAVLLVLMLGALVGATVQQHRRSATAQWAADAVALAVAAEGTGPRGQAVAEELAAANDAVLRSVDTVSPDGLDSEGVVSLVVVVEVEHQGAVAISAAARFILVGNGVPAGGSSSSIGEPPN